MSWNTFKQNVKRVADKPENIENIDVIADLYTNEYDNAIRRGKDLLHSVSVQQTNVQGMRQILKSSLTIGRSSNSPAFNLITEFGKGVIIYWTGATLKNFPIPTIPAPGSISNISVISNLVTSPGVWPPSPPIPPQNTTSAFLDVFISIATAHLQTVSGIVNTTSLYPGTPPVPGPGVLPWIGYVV